MLSRCGDRVVVHRSEVYINCCGGRCQVYVCTVRTNKEPHRVYMGSLNVDDDVVDGWVSMR